MLNKIVWEGGLKIHIFKLSVNLLDRDSGG